MWEYTDGYKMVITSNVGKTVTSAKKHSAHCIKKTTSAITGAYDGGAICFETYQGALWQVGFYAGLNASTYALGSKDHNQKWYSAFPKFVDLTTGSFNNR